MKITVEAPVSITFSLICTIAMIISAFTTTNYFLIAPNTPWYTYLTYIFGHASFQHLLGNLSFILLLGPVLEKHYSSKVVGILIIITALVTAIFHQLFIDSGLLGASGIVFMFILLTSSINIKDKQIPLSFILVTLIYIGKEVYYSFDADNVSQFAHIAGGICGGIAGFLIGRFYNAKETESIPQA